MRVPRALKRKIKQRLATDEGMASFMDDLFGALGWTRDAEADVWVAIDKDYTGPGRGFIVVQRGGDWFKAVIPDEKLA